MIWLVTSNQPSKTIPIYKTCEGKALKNSNLSGIHNIHISQKVIQIALHCHLCTVSNGLLPSQCWANYWQSSSWWNISAWWTKSQKSPLLDPKESPAITAFIERALLVWHAWHKKQHKVSIHLFLTLSSWCTGIYPSSGSSSSCTTAVWSKIPKLGSHSLSFHKKLESKTQW